MIIANEYVIRQLCWGLFYGVLFAIIVIWMVYWFCGEQDETK